MIQECFEGLVFIIAFEAFVSRLGVSTLAAYAIGSQGLNDRTVACFDVWQRSDRLC